MLLQDDIDAGGLVNTATVVGTPPSGAANDVTDITDNGDPAVDGDDAGSDPTDDPEQTLVASAAVLTVEKTATSTDLSVAGAATAWNPDDQITYRVLVQNAGNVTVSGLVLADPLLPADILLTASNVDDNTDASVSGVDLGDDLLQPGEAWAFNYVYAVTQADIDAGEVLNTATVSGFDPQLTPVSDDSDGDGDPSADSPRDSDSFPDNDPNVVLLPQDSELTVQKIADASALLDGVDEGDTLNYTITVENTGNVTLNDVTLTDLFTDAEGTTIDLDSMRDATGNSVALSTNPDGSATYTSGASLDVGEEWTFTAQFDLTEAVIQTGGVENLVIVAATTPSGDPIEAESKVSGNTSRDGDGVPTETGFAGAIQGKVLNYLTGRDGITVRLIDEATNGIVETQVTRNGGTYEFVNLPSGIYAIEFSNPEQNGSVPTATSAEFQETANRINGIVVKAGQVKVEQNAFLVDPSGVIYDSESFAPISGATVTLLYNGASVPDAWLDGTLGDLNGTVTGSDGSYAFLLNPAVAQDGVYSLRVSHPRYVFASDAIPANTNTYRPGLGGGVEQISANSVPASGMLTNYYLAFDLTFDPASAAATSNGVVRNHIPLDRNLADTIEEDLLRILEDDLATTIAQQSRRMEGYSKGALDRLRSRDHLACLAQVNDILEERDIRFDTARAAILPESAPLLDEIAEILQTCEGGSIEVAGHTDDRGSDDYNLRLSKARVEAVILALTVRGVVTEGFVGKGYGERQPIGDNGTAEGRAQNRRVEFNLIDVTETPDYACKDTDQADRSMDASFTDSGLTFSRDSLRERYDCSSDSWTIIEGTASYFDADNGISQAMFNLSYRRERFANMNRVLGYFVGVYGSESDVTGLADGDIRGVGFNGGVYGADRLREGLYLDYYLGAAAGRHEFDLDFERAGGTVNADGYYTYVAGFVGAAVSGKMQYNNVTLTPRAGLDVAYSPGGDVALKTSRNAVSQNSDLRLGSVNGGRLSGELGIEMPTHEGNGSVRVAPRIACHQSIGSLAGTCSLGASIDLAATSDANGFFYNVRLDGERGSNYSAGSLSLSYQKQLWVGTLSGDATMSQIGDFGLLQNFTIEF